MTPYRITEKAVQDLDNIWTFIAQDDPLAADKFIAKLLAVAARLAASPRIGRTRDELEKGLRSFPHGNYLILYHLHGEVVEVARILHGGRNLHAQFNQDE